MTSLLPYSNQTKSESVLNGSPTGFWSSNTAVTSWPGWLGSSLLQLGVHFLVLQHVLQRFDLPLVVS